MRLDSCWVVRVELHWSGRLPIASDLTESRTHKVLQCRFGRFHNGLEVGEYEVRISVNDSHADIMIIRMLPDQVSCVSSR